MEPLGTGSPAQTPDLFGHRPSLLVAFLAASTSGLAILLYAFGKITLTYSLTFLAPLTVTLFLAISVLTGRERESLFMSRLVGGLVAGAVGLLAYNLVRLALLLSGAVPFNPFRPIEVYGLLILDQYQDSTLTRAVGWTFHLWNGLSFATMYTLAVGKGRVAWGLAWAMLLEVAMLATYPSIFQVAMNVPFVTMSLIGHVAYGLAVGLTARRSVRW